MHQPVEGLDGAISDFLRRSILPDTIQFDQVQPRSGWVAGINHGGHDPSVALLHMGRTVVFIEQERLSRRKHATEESPSVALMAALAKAGISIRDLDCIALGSDHDALAQWLGLNAEEKAKILPYDSFEHLFAHANISPREVPPILTFPHHASHAASAFYPSGFKRAAALVMDAMGEDSSTSIFNCSEDGIDLVRSYGVEDSLGFFYEAASAYAGFDKMEAGKFMGLASYGRADMDMPISFGLDTLWTDREHADAIGRNGINLRHEALLQYFEQNHFPYAAGLSDDVMAYTDFAASAQFALEQCIQELAQRAVEDCGSRNLVMAGGVALNCSANGKLARADIADRLFVQPAANDSGVALGAALLASRGLYGPGFAPSVMTHAYWGLEETDEEVEASLRDAELKYVKVTDDQLSQNVADIIAGSGVVAWHQGKAEVGPRSLGARSLLGNPAERKTLIKLNRIKQRELWRPFAPSVLEDRFQDFFVGSPNPFMIVAAKVKDEVRRKIPAVVHVDGSARPQIVNQDANPKYWSLLDKLGAITGIPILINTSLNGKGEPVCHSAKDSIGFFKRSDIDALAINNFLVTREEE
ncbi:hypothetical protein DXT91_24330 [Agrobacterium tumefaciens]|nr:hypothetical protein [Agrobacterium tumefaciens]